MRQELNFDPVGESNKNDGLEPDGVSGKRALEVKYTDDFESSIYNPESLKKFAHGEIIRIVNQVRLYSGLFPGGVTFATNSRAFAATYRSLFEAVGLRNVKYIYLPVSAF